MAWLMAPPLDAANASFFSNAETIYTMPGSAGADAPGALTIQVIVGGMTMVCAPLNLHTQRKEFLPCVALLLAAAGTLQLALTSTMSAHFTAAVLLGAAFGITNAYGTTALWEVRRAPTELRPSSDRAPTELPPSPHRAPTDLPPSSHRAPTALRPAVHPAQPARPAAPGKEGSL